VIDKGNIIEGWLDWDRYECIKNSKIEGHKDNIFHTWIIGEFTAKNEHSMPSHVGWQVRNVNNRSSYGGFLFGKVRRFEYSK